MRTICRLHERVDQIQKGFTDSDTKGDDINFREKGEMPRSSLPKQKLVHIYYFFRIEFHDLNTPN